MQAKEVGLGDKIPTAHKLQVHVKHMAIAESENGCCIVGGGVTCARGRSRFEGLKGGEDR